MTSFGLYSLLKKESRSWRSRVKCRCHQQASGRCVGDNGKAWSMVFIRYWQRPRSSRCQAVISGNCLSQLLPNCKCWAGSQFSAFDATGLLHRPTLGAFLARQGFLWIMIIIINSNTNNLSCWWSTYYIPGIVLTKCLTVKLWSLYILLALD